MNLSWPDTTTETHWTGREVGSSHWSVWYVPDMDDEHIVNVLRRLERGESQGPIPSSEPPTLPALVAEARLRKLEIPARWQDQWRDVEPLPRPGTGPVQQRKRARITPKYTWNPRVD